MRNGTRFMLVTVVVAAAAQLTAICYRKRTLVVMHTCVFEEQFR